MDHDQRFKTLIKTFFLEFLKLFFQEWERRLDVAKIEWLDKEIFVDPPEGDRRILDLVAKLPTRQAAPGHRPADPEQWLALVHIEIESPDWAAPLRPRMFEAYVQLRRHYQLPVLPIAIYLRVGLEGIGIDVYEEHFWELRPVHFEYLYVGLPALDAIKYLEGENWLGVALAALMKIPPDRAAWLGAEALRRLQEAPLNDQQRFLLAECVQAYLPLDEAQRREFERIVNSETYKGVQAMNATWYDKGIEKGIDIGIEKGINIGIEKGIDIGIEKGQRIALRALLEKRFGSLTPALLTMLEGLSGERLQAIQDAALDARSLAELGELGLHD